MYFGLKEREREFSVYRFSTTTNLDPILFLKMNFILDNDNNNKTNRDNINMETSASASEHISNNDTTTNTNSTPTTPLQSQPSQIIDPSDNVGPITKRLKARPAPYSKPILLSGDRRSRKKNVRLSWPSEEKIHKVHYFEYIPDERCNVTRMNNTDQQNDANASANSASGSSLNPNANKAVGAKISHASVDPIRRSNGKTESEKYVEYSPWRPLILIDFTPELPSPGWNSLERSAQAERETYVLGAIDLPGQPSTLDEPDQQQQTKAQTTSADGSSNVGNTSTTYESTNAKDDASNIKTIPLENPEGMFTEYPDMYSSEIINGVKMPTDNPQPVVPNMTSFCNQQSQLLPNQYQQQLVQTNQNPFAFQDMGAQFQPQPQQQAQLSIQQFIFQQQQQPFQAPIASQQQQLAAQQPPQQQQPAPFVDQQSALTGPLMPWLSYPFNQVNENSHAHLFKRPAT